MHDELSLLLQAIPQWYQYNTIHTAGGCGGSWDAATGCWWGTCSGCNLDDPALFSSTWGALVCSAGGWSCCALLSLSGWAESLLAAALHNTSLMMRYQVQQCIRTVTGVKSQDSFLMYIHTKTKIESTAHILGYFLCAQANDGQPWLIYYTFGSLGNADDLDKCLQCLLIYVLSGAGLTLLFIYRAATLVLVLDHGLNVTTFASIQRDNSSPR